MLFPDYDPADKLSLTKKPAKQPTQYSLQKRFPGRLKQDNTLFD
jgi:hypothetical protein